MYKNYYKTWWAIVGFVLLAGIIVMSLTLYYVTQNPLWMILAFSGYLLRPTLASLGPTQKLYDERQLSINYQSSNIGYVVMLLACIVFAIKLSLENNHDYTYFVVAFSVGIAAKGLFDVILARTFRANAPKFIIAMGVFIILTGALYSESTSQTVFTVIPGLAIVGLGLLAKKSPRIVGAAIIILTVVSIVLLFALGKDRQANVFFSVVGLILSATGASLLGSGRDNIEEESKSAK